MQDAPSLNESLSLTLFVLLRNLEVVQLSDKLKPFQKGPFKTKNKPTEITYEF